MNDSEPKFFLFFGPLEGMDVIDAADDHLSMILELTYNLCALGKSDKCQAKVRGRFSTVGKGYLAGLRKGCPSAAKFATRI
jgi:hypothetical protein